MKKICHRSNSRVAYGPPEYFNHQDHPAESDTLKKYYNLEHLEKHELIKLRTDVDYGPPEVFNKNDLPVEHDSLTLPTSQDSLIKSMICYGPPEVFKDKKHPIQPIPEDEGE